MRKLIVAIVCAFLGPTGIGLPAQGGSIGLVPPSPSGVKFGHPCRPAGIGGDTMVVGTVIDIRQVPVAYVKVQLRSLVTGTVQQEAESNEFGEYEFVVDAPGIYVVEMVTVDGSVAALSNAGSLAQFEILCTLVQLPGRWDTKLRTMVLPQNTISFLGLSAQSTMTSVTLTMALDMNIAPVNAGEPVSATTTSQ